MNVRIKRIDTNLPLPAYESDGACAFDMYSRETITIEPGKIELLPSNFVIEVPVGYVLVLTARSSLARKKGLMLANSVGVIDQDYSGNNDEILISVRNTGDAAVTVERGERIAQGLILPIARATWQEVETMDNKNRGGFGSTGGYKEAQS